MYLHTSPLQLSPLNLRTATVLSVGQISWLRLPETCAVTRIGLYALDSSLEVEQSNELAIANFLRLRATV
ncbi:hypothetical protein RRG08_066304 [Elysia crispata]|uniref:Uncharacterized protein n=1 Tax=Elysia crispata TaxID=231223 RepID=A0AAE1AMV2_9GAST|nr:hypothetical protein RRG08_066304 [Elysia crispata]